MRINLAFDADTSSSVYQNQLHLFTGLFAGIYSFLIQHDILQAILTIIAGRVTSYAVSYLLRMGEIYIWGALPQNTNGAPTTPSTEGSTAAAAPASPEPNSQRPSFLRSSSYSLRGLLGHVSSTLIGLVLFGAYAYLLHLHILTVETAPILLPITLFLLYRGKIAPSDLQRPTTPPDAPGTAGGAAGAFLLLFLLSTVPALGQDLICSVPTKTETLEIDTAARTQLEQGTLLAAARMEGTKLILEARDPDGRGRRLSYRVPQGSTVLLFPDGCATILPGGQVPKSRSSKTKNALWISLATVVVGGLATAFTTK